MPLNILYVATFEKGLVEQLLLKLDNCTKVFWFVPLPTHPTKVAHGHSEGNENKMLSSGSSLRYSDEKSFSLS